MPLRERMIEDMRIWGLSDKSRQAHIRAVKDLPRFWGAHRIRRRRRNCALTASHDGCRILAVSLQRACHCPTPLFLDDLWARGDEAVQAVPH